MINKTHRSGDILSCFSYMHDHPLKQEIYDNINSYAKQLNGYLSLHNSIRIEGIREFGLLNEPSNYVVYYKFNDSQFKFDRQELNIIKAEGVWKNTLLSELWNKIDQFVKMSKRDDLINNVLNE